MAQTSGDFRVHAKTPLMLHDAINTEGKGSARCLARRYSLSQVPVDPATMKVDVRATARAMSANTIMIYASAPSFPHGVIDPVEDLARLATRYGVSNCRRKNKYIS